MISRRSVLRFFGATIFGTISFASYAFAIEPRYRLVVTRYRLRPPRWPALAKPLRMAVIADVHACEPWMPISRITEIVDTTNALEPDVTVLPGDYIAGLAGFRTSRARMREWGPGLGRPKAPPGGCSILCNHDWCGDASPVRNTLRNNGIPCSENDVRLIQPKAGPKFRLVGLGDQSRALAGRT